MEHLNLAESNSVLFNTCVLCRRTVHEKVNILKNIFYSFSVNIKSLYHFDTYRESIKQIHNVDFYVEDSTTLNASISHKKLCTTYLITELQNDIPSRSIFAELKYFIKIKF